MLLVNFSLNAWAWPKALQSTKSKNTICVNVDGNFIEKKRKEKNCLFGFLQFSIFKQWMPMLVCIEEKMPEKKMAIEKTHTRY